MVSSPTPKPPTRRDLAKAARRRELLTAAAKLMAERGYSGVRLEDIGAAVGVSGPAMYRHFSGKDDLLAQMLIEVSARLLDGGISVVDDVSDASDALDNLVEYYVDFALNEPDLITVQDRNLSSLAPEASKTVRSMQRRFVELWTDVVARCHPEFPRREAGLRVQAVFGLLNSSPQLPAIEPARARGLLIEMARAALGATPRDHGDIGRIRNSITGRAD